jgi:AGZA family xanthine/uracil permease-like MFS transporter
LSEVFLFLKEPRSNGSNNLNGYQGLTMFEKFFKLKGNHTTITKELLAGVVTFMTMAYIIFVNPEILGEAMGKELIPALTVATCLGAGIATICMGLFTNYPLALASGIDFFLSSR